MNARAAAAEVRAQLVEAGIIDASLEAELLVREAAGMSRAGFFAGACISEGSRGTLGAFVSRRLHREPAAYISGHREFFGLDMMVAPGVLIPRPETELLVEIALAELRTYPAAVVLDVGTGSGCIATAIAANAPDARVLATDISEDTLTVARHNAEKHAVDVSFVTCDLASAVRHADIVVANLPYIPTATIESLEPEVREWEPRLALDGGQDGLVLVRRLIEDCATRLRPRLLALEVMAGQADDIARFAHAHGAGTTIRRDLAGIDRVVMARWA